MERRRPMSTDLVPVTGAERDDHEQMIVTKEFLAAFQELTQHVRSTTGDLNELESLCFGRGTPLSRRRAHEVGQTRCAVLESLTAAERALKKEYDRVQGLRERAEARRTLAPR
jgi:hypothetical protein